MSRRLRLPDLATPLILLSVFVVSCRQSGPGVSSGPATWRLAHPVGAEATSLDLLIQEGACASGKSPEGRILPPTVSYSPTAITISVRVATLPGPQDCQGNSDYPLTVRLTDPVGDRMILGGMFEQHPGTSPTPPPSSHA
jgi:hypothetical protein